MELLYHIEKEHSSKTENNVKNTGGQDEPQIYCELCSIKCKNKKLLRSIWIVPMRVIIAVRRNSKESW